MLLLNNKIQRQHNNIEIFFKKYSRNNFFSFKQFRNEKFDKNKRLNDIRINNFSFKFIYNQFRREKYFKLFKFDDIYKK